MPGMKINMLFVSDICSSKLNHRAQNAGPYHAYREGESLHDDEVPHDVKAVSVRSQSQFFPTAPCADPQVAVLINTPHHHLLVATATQLHHRITAG